MNWSELNTPERSMKNTSMTYVHHLTKTCLLFIRGIRFGKNSSRTSFNNKRMTDNTISTEVGGEERKGAEKKLGLKMSEIIPHASPIDPERKKIHKKFTNKKVTRILILFPMTPYLHLFCPVIFSTIWNKPCKMPQTTNVQLAPCQIPLTKKVTKIFQ